KTFNLTITFKGGNHVTVDKVDLQMDMLERLHKIKKSYIRQLHVNLSESTESVYGMVTFKRRQGVFVFAIKNHKTRIDSVSKSYWYGDYTSLENLIETVSKDIDLAHARRLNCVSAQLSLVEYDVLTRLSKMNQTLRVELNKHNRVVKHWYEQNGRKLRNFRIEGVTDYILDILYERKLLGDRLNRKEVKE